MAKIMLYLFVYQFREFFFFFFFFHFFLLFLKSFFIFQVSLSVLMKEKLYFYRLECEPTEQFRQTK